MITVWVLFLFFIFFFNFGLKYFRRLILGEVTFILFCVLLGSFFFFFFFPNSFFSFANIFLLFWLNISTEGDLILWFIIINFYFFILLLILVCWNTIIENTDSLMVEKETYLDT